MSHAPMIDEARAASTLWQEALRVAYLDAAEVAESIVGVCQHETAGDALRVCAAHLRRRAVIGASAQ